MNTKNHLFFAIIFACLFFNSTAQEDCTCESNFEWVKKTFEQNDAGFQYIIDKKGQAAYNIHNQLVLEKIKAAKTSTECNELLYEWLKFFRFGHIGIERLTNETSTLTITSQNVIQPAQHTETWKGDISQFEEYIDTKEEVDFEGIWETGAYKIGVQKEGMNYMGFIIESGVETWKPKQIKLKIEQSGDKFKATYYMRDHSPIESDELEMISDNYLKIRDNIILKRLSPAFPTDPLIENYFKSMDSQTPYLEELNVTTLYLRIPSFLHSEKHIIDSVITANKDIILKTENLIIDIRNGTGGSDASYYELLPLLYTNPIREISAEFLSTKQNNQRLLDWSTDPDFDEDTRKLAKDIYEQMQQRLGEFVRLSGEDVTIYNQDVVYEYPKNVGIIINERNGSTDEQFLLAAKQSKKVKLFGTTTFGALDISNMYSVDSPCEEFRLWYCLSRSMRIPNMTIDDIGLQPDYYLDKTIPSYKWVEFVNEILNY